jgi:hypothetical protein
MVDLLPQSGRIVTSEAPRSSLSGQDIASPYMELADNFNRAADLSNDVSTKQAEKAGAEAVSPDGKTISQPGGLPLVGDPAAAFHKAALVTSLNRITPDIENKMTELRLQHQNDPSGFKAAADAFTKQYLTDNVPDPMLKGPVEKTALTTASANYRHVLQSTDSQNVQNLLTTSQAQLTDINDRSASLARQGLVDTPQYAELHQARSVLYNTLAGDPRTGFTPERAALELKDNRDRDVVQQTIGQVVGGAENEADARKKLSEKFWGAGSENLRLSPQKRDAAINEGVAAWNNKNAEDSAAVAELRSTVNGYATNIQANPGSFNDIAHNSLVAQAAAKGDTKSVAALSAVKTMAPLWQNIMSLPMADRASALHEIERGIVPSDRATEAMTILQSRGYSKEAAAGIVGNLSHESPGLNPTAMGDGGTSGGIAQWHNERLTALKQFAADKGKPWTDFHTQIDFLDRELQTSEGATGTALKGAKTAQEAAHAFMSFERPQGWTPENPAGGLGYSKRVANAVRLAGGDPGSLAPGMPIANSSPQVQRLFQSTVAQLREQQGKEADRLADDLIDRLKKNQQPAPGQIQDIVSAANAGNRPDIVQKVQPVVAAADLAAGVPADGGMAAEAFKAQASAAAAGGAGIIERKVLENARANVAAAEEAYKKDPIGASANSGFVKPNGPLVTQDPGLFGQELAARQAKIGVIQQRNGNPAPIKAVGDGEAPALATALTQGDPQTAAGLLGAMSKSLSPDNYRETLSSKPVADAISGMAFSRDPARMGTALTVMDQLWKQDPHKTEQAFGKDAIDRMQVWQGLRSSFSDAEIAQRFQEVDDPARAAAKKTLTETAQKETEKVTPDDVASKFRTGIWGLRAVTGGSANVPIDGLAANEMAADYKTVRTALRTYGVPADKADDLALKRMQQSWGPSPSNGNQVMKYPPERYYPDVGGHAWITDAIQKEAEAVLGPQQSQYAHPGRDAKAVQGADFLRSSATPNWQVVGLAPSQDAAARIAAGQPPAYSIVVQKRDGQIETLRSPTGQTAMTFDPTPYQAKYEAEQRRQVGIKATAAAIPSPPIGSFGAMLGL